MNRFPYNPEDQKLITTFEGIGTHLSEAQEWVENFRENEALLRRELGWVGESLDIAKKAANSALTVGLYGGSQVGKSFLVSGLAAGKNALTIEKPAGDHPEAKWNADDGINFLRYVNDENANEDETTGLVTRFSTDQSAKANSPGTYVVELVSHADFVDMLASGFRAENRRFDGIDIETVNDYIDAIDLDGGTVNEALRKDFIAAVHRLRSNEELRVHYVTILENSKLLTFLEGLTQDPGVEGWKKVASIFWGLGEFPAFDRLYSKCESVYRRVNYASRIEVPWQAICRRGGNDEKLVSLTSVKILNELYDDNSQSRYTVRYGEGGKHTTDLLGGEISAVAAELILPVQCEEQEEVLIKKADLLDFPGALPTHKYNKSNFNPEDENWLKNATFAFRRGKLLRLFDRYCTNREITVLVICADQQNPFKFGDLMPGQIDRWLHTRYPSYPEMDQEEIDNPSLFFVRTKADLALEGRVAEKGNADNPLAETITTQMDYFERGSHDANHRWFSNWAATKPFDNIHLAFDIRKAGIEVITPRIQSEIDNFGESFMSSDLLEKHLKNREEKLEAFNPVENGDGEIVTKCVEYLVDQITQKVSPLLKRRELEMEADHLIERIISILPEYRLTDEGEQKRLAEKNAEKILRELQAREEQLIMGKLLQTLVLKPTVVVDLLEQRNGDLAQKINGKWREQISLQLEREEGDAKDGVKSLKTLNVLLDEMSRLKLRMFPESEQNTLKALTRGQTNGVAARQMTSKAVARVWNNLHDSLGTPIQAAETPSLPVTLADFEKPWRRIQDHWEKNLKRVMVENVTEGYEENPGNVELGELLEKIGKTQN